MLFRAEAYHWLSRSIGITTGDVGVMRMKGSTSSAIFLVHSLRDFNLPKFVLRVLDNRQWLKEEPDLAAHEAAALEEAQKSGVPAPRLVAYSSADVGFNAPVVLMSHLEGEILLRPTNLRRWLCDLARQLAALHRYPAEAFPWRFRSWCDKGKLAPPEWAAAPCIWEEAVAIALGPAPASQQVFIHRDYHPVNVLWKNESVSGVVDWINACQGPAGVDVAHCRTNLALMFGPDAADWFLAEYVQAADHFVYHPYWDIDSMFDSCLPQPVFYEPWREFGFGLVAPEILRRRIEDYLERIMRRV